MNVTIEDVRRVARLARLKFTEEEEKVLVEELGTILDYVSQLASIHPQAIVDISDVDAEQSRLRADQTEPSISREEALRNAPATSGDYFEVPKVIQ